MTTQTHAEIHADHHQWRSDVKMWRDDIEAWKNEQARLLSDIEIALGANVAGMKKHAASVGEHESHLVHHEHVIAECERSSTPRPSHVANLLTDNHEHEASKHAGLRETHERIKQHHRRAMARLDEVLKLLGRGV